MIGRESVTRERLYEEVWAEPMLAVAKRYGVSSSFMARVCRRMRVPCPPRGYWAKVNGGASPRKPKLPAPQPGDEISWAVGGGGTRLPPPAPSLRAKPRTADQPTEVASGGQHPHLHGIEAYFTYGDVTSQGYFRPSKRAMADIFVSKSMLARALEVANQFYLHLQAMGHQVGFGSSTHRPKLFYCDGAKDYEYYSGNWHPSRPTVARFGTLEIGLTIFEFSEMAEAKSVNGKYVRISELPPAKRDNRASPLVGWGPYKHGFLTGRLAIHAFSPYWQVPWERRWIEPEPGALPGMFDEIARSLKRQAAVLVPRIKEVLEKERLEALRNEAAHQEWLKQRAIEEAEKRKAAEAQARAKAITDSKHELLGLIQKWDEATRLREFLAELDAAVAEVPAAERGPLLERIRKAKAFLSEFDVLGSIRMWKTPEERFSSGP